MTTREAFAERGLGDMIDAVALDHHCTVKDILSGNRSMHIVRARRALTGKLRELGMSYPMIGLLLNQDHTTCIEQHTRRRSNARKAAV